MAEVDVARELKILRETADLPDVSSEVSEDMTKLANDSRDFLGYKPLHNKLVTGTGHRLADVLIELQIEVLDPEAILKYQEKLGAPNKFLRSLVEEQVVEEDDERDDDDDEADDEDDDTDDDSDEEAPRSRFRRGMEWARIEIKSYRKPVPAHVLQKAVEIKRALPTAEFFVEELRHKPDPFMIVTFQNEQYYFEVWEEPTFEGRVDAASKGRKSKR